MDEALDIGYRAKISPRAFEFLVDMAAKVSYQEATNILAATGGSVVSANTNADYIRKTDYTLGTMECEQEHMYKSRFAGVPRAWSVAGVDAIARIRSRKHSGRDLVFRTRKETIPKEVTRRREKRVYEVLEKQPYVYQKTVGHGYN